MRKSVEAATGPRLLLGRIFGRAEVLTGLHEGLRVGECFEQQSRRRTIENATTLQPPRSHRCRRELGTNGSSKSRDKRASGANKPMAISNL